MMARSRLSQLSWYLNNFNYLGGWDNGPFNNQAPFILFCWFLTRCQLHSIKSNNHHACTNKLRVKQIIIQVVDQYGHGHILRKVLSATFHYKARWYAQAARIIANKVSCALEPILTTRSNQSTVSITIYICIFIGIIALRNTT